MQNRHNSVTPLGGLQSAPRGQLGIANDHVDKQSAGGVIDVLITATKVAGLLGVSENALARMRQQGAGPPFVKMGRRVRYGQSDLLFWLAARRYPNEGTSS